MNPGAMFSIIALIFFLFVFAAPNKMTNIGIRMTNVTRLKLPYVSNCTTSYPDFFAREYHMSDQIKYSDLACSNLCLQVYQKMHAVSYDISNVKVLVVDCDDWLLQLFRSDGHGGSVQFQQQSQLLFNRPGDEKETMRQQCPEKLHESINGSVSLPSGLHDDFSRCEIIVPDSFRKSISRVFQTTIAATEWPSGIDWALVAENNNVTYRNTTIRYNIALKLEANSSIWSSGGMTEYNMIKDHVTENFLQAQYWIKIFFKKIL